ALTLLDWPFFLGSIASAIIFGTAALFCWQAFPVLVLREDGFSIGNRSLSFDSDTLARLSPNSFLGTTVTVHSRSGSVSFRPFLYDGGVPSGKVGRGAAAIAVIAAKLPPGYERDWLLTVFAPPETLSAR